MNSKQPTSNAREQGTILNAIVAWQQQSILDRPTECHKLLVLTVAHHDEGRCTAHWLAHIITGVHRRVIVGLVPLDGLRATITDHESLLHAAGSLLSGSCGDRARR